MDQDAFVHPIKELSSNSDIKPILASVSQSIVDVVRQWQAKENNQAVVKYADLTLVIRKLSGYSFTQNYQVNLTALENQSLLKIIKKSKASEQPEQVSKQLSQQFSITQSQQQKLLIMEQQQSILPHLKAMKLDNNWDNTKIQEKKLKKTKQPDDDDDDKSDEEVEEEEGAEQQ